MLGLRASQRGLDTRQDHRQVEGLADDIVGASGHGVHGLLGAVVPGHQDDRHDAGCDCETDVPQDVWPAETGGPDIQQDEVEWARPDECQCGGAGGGGGREGARHRPR